MSLVDRTLNKQIWESSDSVIDMRVKLKLLRSSIMSEDAYINIVASIIVKLQQEIDGLQHELKLKELENV